jgi:hypothetical protein
MFNNSTDLPGFAALATILWAALILWSQHSYPFVQTFPHDIGTPVLALELARNSDEIDAVLHCNKPEEGCTEARAIQNRANELDLAFIPVYTFYLWAVARLFSRRMVLLTVLIVATGIFDYWEDWRIFQALNGHESAIFVPSLYKWALMALVLMATGVILATAGGAIYSFATNRLLAVAYWLSGGLMGTAVATGKWLGYSLIPLSMEIFSAVTLIHVIGLLGHYLTIQGVSPVYTEDFCARRGKTGEESFVAVKPGPSQ